MTPAQLACLAEYQGDYRACDMGPVLRPSVSLRSTVLAIGAAVLMLLAAAAAWL